MGHQCYFVNTKTAYGKRKWGRIESSANMEKPRRRELNRLGDFAMVCAYSCSGQRGDETHSCLGGAIDGAMRQGVVKNVGQGVEQYVK